MSQLDPRAQVLRLSVDPSAVDALGDALLAHGADSVSVEGAADAPAIYGEPGSDPAAYWASCVLAATFPAHADVAVAVAKAGRDVGVPIRPLGPVERVPDRDWERVSREGFAPWRVTAGLVIAPPWRASQVAPARVVVIDPGPAFGSGHHPTTRLCVEWLVRSVQGGERVLDFGCGTGILGLVAVALGARCALGVDVDPRALAAARANATASGLALELAGELSPRFGADLVVANILAAPLVGAASALVGALAPGGAIALAGVRVSDVPVVRDAYARASGGALDLGVAAEDADWVLLAGAGRV